MAVVKPVCGLTHIIPETRVSVDFRDADRWHLLPREEDIRPP